MSFEDLFKQEIPTVEAAEFFVSLKGDGLTKQAEWTDPPDMEGLLEGQCLVPVEQVVAKLKEVITAKYRLMVAYYTYAESINDVAWRSMKDEFHEHAYDEKSGAQFYTKRAAVLGGPVHLDPIEPPPASNNPIGILKIMIRAEQEGIAAQRELRQLVGDENPMKIGIETQLERDQHHLDELFQMLPKAEQQALELGGMPMPHDEATETPEEEAAEPPEVQAAEEAAGVEEPPAEPPAEEPSEQEVVASMRMDALIMKVAKEKETDEQLKEKGRERGVTGLAAEATREKGRRGERAGKTVGMLGGGAAGAALGKKYLGGPVGTLGGMAAGALAGRGVGEQLGTEYDIAKNAAAQEVIASMRMDAILHKLAQEPGTPADEAGDGMTTPTAGELQPQNYLAAEMAGQQAQAGNEANYYREQLGQAQMTAQQAQQQMSDVQMQLDQLQQQADQSGEQIQAAAQEAMAARDDAVNATMEVAKARIGAQKMRQGMLDLASQDPAALGEEAMAPQPMMGPDGQPMGPEGEPGAPDAGMQEPPAEAGPAGAAAPPGAAPGAEPPAGEPDMTGPVGAPPGAEGEGAEATTQLKTGSALLGALGGAALGAGGSFMAGRQAPALRESVQRLEASQDGSFGQAAALASARGASAGADLSAAHPVRSAISGGLGGGLAGAAMGPSLVSGVQELAGRHIPAAYRRATGG